MFILPQVKISIIANIYVRLNLKTHQLIFISRQQKKFKTTMSNFNQDEITEKVNSQNLNQTLKSASQCQLEKKKEEKKIQRCRRKAMRKRIYTQRYNNGYWTDQQNGKYCQFLKKNQNLFEMNPRYRKIAKVHVLMSKHVKTRSSDQCRSHHQKMLKFHGNLLSTVEHIEGFLSIQPSQPPVKIEVKVEEQIKYPFQNYRYYEFNPYLSAINEEWRYPVTWNPQVPQP